METHPEVEDVEHGSKARTYEMVATNENAITEEAPTRLSPDIVWSDLNFVAGGKNILTKCWGKVSQW